MMVDDPRLPRAFLEALTDDDTLSPEQARREAAEAVATLAGLADPVQPKGDLSLQLLQEISEAPLRYAPFFSRLTELFDLEDEELEQTVGRLKDPRNWRATGLRGVRRIDVTAGPRLKTATASFVRFAPGAHFPPHRHHGFEQVFVLEGSYTDDAGVLHGPGDLHEMQDATEHEFWTTTGPCIAASVLHGNLRFTKWPAKFFNFFMKR